MRGWFPYRIIMKVLEKLYLFTESRMEYPDDHTILGVFIDSDLQKMTRRELCDFIEDNTPGEGSFWRLPSTTKIRFGCQMMQSWQGDSTPSQSASAYGRQSDGRDSHGDSPTLVCVD
jgi:hypothetical protein